MRRCLMHHAGQVANAHLAAADKSNQSVNDEKCISMCGNPGSK